MKDETMTNKSNTKVDQFDPRDVESKEPPIDYPRITLDDKIGEDRTTDPEGATRRAAPSAGANFPMWVYGDFEESKLDYWGRPWKDGRVHLIPRKATVLTVLELHHDGLGNLIDRATAGKKEDPASYDLLHTSYTTLVEMVDPRHHYGIIRGLGDQVTTLLAERAYTKHRLLQALDSQRPDNPNSDYIENAETAAMQASYDAGIWWQVHQDSWVAAGFKNEPTYPRVENAIAMRLINVASYIESKHRNTQGPAPLTEDRKAIVANL